MPQPWDENIHNIHIQTEVPQVTPGEGQNDVIRRSLTLAMIEEQYPPEAWIHGYTDGSATNAVTNGGAGVLISTPEGERIESRLPTGKHCTNYAAEEQALIHAVDQIVECRSNCQQIALFTDAKSVLEALEGNRLPGLARKLKQLSSYHRVTLQWIPAHCGIPGNETADGLAKQGARETQQERDVTLEEKKTMIKAAFRPATSHTRDDYHSLDRWQQVTVLRLRTGHCRLKSHLHRKMRLVPSPNCTCGNEETVEHVLQSCPLYDQERKKTWPVPTTVNQKLYGHLDNLIDTVSFIRSTGLAI